MRLDDEQESSNFNVQGPGSGGRGFGFPMGGGGGIGLGRGGLGCGSIALLAVAALVFGINPLTLIGPMLGGGQMVAPEQQQRQTTPGDTSQLTDVQRVSLRVLGSTERRWGELFGRSGQQYPAPRMEFYSRNGQSGCGAAQSAMGPFYCPADRSIYIDTQFFEDMATRYNAPGDFPIGYIIAHEVGHHIQTIDGTADRVRSQQGRVGRAAGNALQVKMELQADCYAGVWAANDRNLLEPGDVEEGLRAAQAIGDDTLQRAAQGTVVPESFTHGSAAQRQQWLQRGLSTGDPAACDTFAT